MENILRNNFSKFLLVGQINGLTWEAKKNKKKLLKAKAVEKQALFSSNKHYIKSNIRHRLLAYAFLSGKDYHAIERACGENNKPSTSLILNIINSLDPIWHPTSRWRYNPNESDIQKWLEGQMS